MRFLALAFVVSGVASALAPTECVAQTPPSVGAVVGSTLSLADAIALAKRNNPAYQTSVNGRRSAASNLHVANGAIFPTFNSSFGGSYREGKQQLLQGQAFGSTNGTLGTDGSINAQFSLSPGFLNDRRAARANLDAADADVSGAEQTLRANVTNAYILVLQDQATALLQDTLLVNTSSQLELAKAKLQVGTATQLDVDRADVANGTQRVSVLRAHNQVDIDKLRLFQQMGVQPSLSTNVEALSNMQMPTQSLGDLTAMAKTSNPILEAARYRQVQAAQQQLSARKQYLPSFSVSTSYGGYAQRYTDTDALILQSQNSVVSSKASCIRNEEVRAALNLSNQLAQCNSIAFSPAQEAAIRSDQSAFPFGFTRNAYGLNVGLSLPLFNGFQREGRIEQAKITRLNNENAVRTQELGLTADVNAAYLNLTISQQAAQLQEQNAATARRALTLAQERYRVGTISLVDLIQARSDFNTAETQRITAIYDFQRAFAQLESAVGRPLR